MDTFIPDSSGNKIKWKYCDSWIKDLFDLTVLYQFLTTCDFQQCTAVITYMYIYYSPFLESIVTLLQTVCTVTCNKLWSELAGDRVQISQYI